MMCNIAIIGRVSMNTSMSENTYLARPLIPNLFVMLNPIQVEVPYDKALEEVAFIVVGKDTAKGYLTFLPPTNFL